MVSAESLFHQIDSQQFITTRLAEICWERLQESIEDKVATLVSQYVKKHAVPSNRGLLRDIYIARATDALMSSICDFSLNNSAKQNSPSVNSANSKANEPNRLREYVVRESCELLCAPGPSGMEYLQNETQFSETVYKAMEQSLRELQRKEQEDYLKLWTELDEVSSRRGHVHSTRENEKVSERSKAVYSKKKSRPDLSMKKRVLQKPTSIKEETVEILKREHPLSPQKVSEAKAHKNRETGNSRNVSTKSVSSKSSSTDERVAMKEAQRTDAAVPTKSRRVRVLLRSSHEAPYERSPPENKIFIKRGVKIVPPSIGN